MRTLEQGNPHPLPATATSRTDLPTARPAPLGRVVARAAAVLGAALAIGGPATAADHVTIDLKNLDAEVVGRATLTALPGGGVLLDATLDGLEPGAHGFHIHETGRCDASTGFKSAGGHLAGDREHGFLVEDGPHPGDMPNVHVPDSGTLRVEVVNSRVSLEADGEGALLDDDGSALLIHAGADDYTSQSAGDAGERVACAEIRVAP